MIHCFGNSHAVFFSGQDCMLPKYPEYHEDLLPEFKAYHFSSTLAYNLYEYKADELSNICHCLVNKEKDYILLAFNEGDCRWHLGHQAEVQNRPVDDLIKECVERYFKVFLRLKNEGFKLIAWGAH